MHTVSIHQMTHTIAGHGCAVHLGELVRMRAGDHGINRRMTGGLLVRSTIEPSDQAWPARLHVSSVNLNNESVAGARDAQMHADHADLPRKACVGSTPMAIAQACWMCGIGGL